MIDRTIAPAFVTLKDVKLPEVTSHKLKNGIHLHAINAGKQPVINLQLLFKAGKWYEEVPGSALVLSKLMLEGTKSYSALQINNYFESHGIFWEIYAGYDHLTIDIYLLTKYLNKITDILFSILKEALLPQEEFINIKSRLAQQLTVNIEKTGYVASAKYRNSLFGSKHPYGYYLDQALLEKVSYEQVKEFYDAQIKDKHFELVVSGAIDEQVLAEVQQSFESIELGTIERMPASFIVESKLESLEEDWDGKLQTSLRIGQIAPTKNSRDSLSFELMNRILGGYFGSRLMKNLREEKGLTYGVQSSTVYLINHAYQVIATDIIKEKKALAKEEIYKEIEQLTQYKVPEDELQVVKNYLTGSFIKSINSPFSLAQYFRTVHFHNLEKDYFNSYVSKIYALTADDILEAAQNYFKRPFLEVTIG